MIREPIKKFEDLMVWQKGIGIVKKIYLCTLTEAFRRDFGLTDQMRRAAVSIPTNIAEGFERSSRKEYLNFLNIAKGSAGEVRSLLQVALEVGYIEKESHDLLRESVLEVSCYLSNQMKSLKGVHQ